MFSLTSRYHILFLILAAGLRIETYAQQVWDFNGKPEDGITVTGIVKGEGGNASQGSIKIYRNGTLYAEVIPGSSGKYEADLPFDGDYEMEFSAPGCVTKRIEVETGLPKELQGKPQEPLAFNMSLPKASGGPVDEAYTKPVSRLYFDKAAGDFGRDMGVEENFRSFLRTKQAEHKQWLADQKSKASEDKQKQQSEAEKAKAAAEEARRLAEVAAKKKAEEEEARRLADKKAAEEAAAAARKKAEDEARWLAEQAAKKKAEEEAALAKRRSDEDSQRRMEEAARKKAEEEAAREKRRTDDETRWLDNEAARKKAEEEAAAAKRRSDEDAQRRMEEAARKKAEEEAERERRRMEEEARWIEEQNAKKKTEEEAFQQNENSNSRPTSRGSSFQFTVNLSEEDKKKDFSAWERFQNWLRIRSEKRDETLEKERTRKEEYRKLRKADIKRTEELAEKKRLAEERRIKRETAERIQRLKDEEERKKRLEESLNKKIVVLVAYASKSYNNGYYGYVNFGDGKGPLQLTEAEYKEMAKRYEGIYNTSK